jgi:hypothetical protein
VSFFTHAFFSLSLLIPCIILLLGSFMHSAFGY